MTTGETRFMTLPAVAEELSVSPTQVYALLRSGDLPGVKIGGRGVWRIERTELEAFITRCRVTP
jgi:excisionase family DNA binding protein